MGLPLLGTMATEPALGETLTHDAELTVEQAAIADARRSAPFRRRSTDVWLNSTGGAGWAGPPPPDGRVLLGAHGFLASQVERLEAEIDAMMPITFGAARGLGRR